MTIFIFLQRSWHGIPVVGVGVVCCLSLCYSLLLLCCFSVLLAAVVAVGTVVFVTVAVIVVNLKHTLVATDLVNLGNNCGRFNLNNVGFKIILIQILNSETEMLFDLCHWGVLTPGSIHPKSRTYKIGPN